MPDTTDQAQSQEGTEPETAPEGAETDNQQTSAEDQSKEGETQDELYELPNGEKVDAQTLSKKWKEEFYPEFTRRSQALAEFKKQRQEQDARADDEARRSVADNELLKTVPPNVKEAIVQIVRPVIEQSFQQQKQLETQRQQDMEFEKTLNDLEKEFPGGKGQPKFEREKIIEAMKAPGNRNFDPRSKFLELHSDDLKDVWLKEALKKQQSGTDTETTGSSAPKGPDVKTPKTFDEARQAFESRLS